jgi:long-chain fatty acid transport protein|tara:strand:+ start:6940 stop:8109 length:1170 start_codon:yes stop_codon:yes gene_type:complete
MLLIAEINMKSQGRCRFLFLLCAVGATQTYSAAYQIFPTLAYNNAAMLNDVNKYTAMIGTTDIVEGMSYIGTNGPNFGKAVTETNTVLPYARMASRANDKWVMSFDVSHPLFANVSYPVTAFMSTAGTDAIIYDTNYSPKVSYQILDGLALGIGFDANNVSNSESNFGQPPELEAQNISQGWGYGWDAGLVFKLNEFNRLSFSYYSRIDFPRLKGTSTLGNKHQSDFSSNLVAPTTFTLNAMHQVTPEWSLSETARFVLWGQEKNLTLTNSVAGDVTIPLNYNDIWSLMLTTRYQFSERWAWEGLFEYQGNAQSIIYRPIVLPTTDLVIGGVMCDFSASSQWSAQVRYNYVYANTGIDQAGPPSRRGLVNRGRVNIGINIMDVGLTWKM